MAINWPEFKFPPINLWSKPMRLEIGESAMLRDGDKIETLEGEQYEIKPMSNELRLQNKYFMAYIESRKPLTPEQYRIAKESYEAGFRDYRKFFNELNK